MLATAAFTLSACQVLGHLLFTGWQSRSAAPLFVLEPCSNPHSRQAGGVGGVGPPAEPRSDEHPTSAALCRSERPDRSWRWVSESFWSHMQGMTGETIRISPGFGVARAGIAVVGDFCRL